MYRASINAIVVDAIDLMQEYRFSEIFGTICLGIHRNRKSSTASSGISGRGSRVKIEDLRVSLDQLMVVHSVIHSVNLLDV